MAIDYEKTLRAAYLPSLDGKLPSQKQEDIYKFDGKFTPYLTPEQKEKQEEIQRYYENIIKKQQLTEPQDNTYKFDGIFTKEQKKMRDLLKALFTETEKERAKAEKEKFEKDALQREKTRITRNADFEKLSKFDDTKDYSTEDIYFLVNNPSHADKAIHLDGRYKDIIKNMDDIERRTFTYHANKHGSDRATQYFLGLEPTIKERMANGEHYQEYYSDLNQEIKDMERVRQATDFDQYKNVAEGELDVLGLVYSKNKGIPGNGDFEKIANFMEPYEKETYNYYFHKFGEESALNYYKLIERKINQRQAEYKSKQTTEFAEEHPVLADVSYPIASLGNFAGLLATAGQNIKNNVTGKDVPVDINSRAFSTVRYRNDVQQSLTEGKSGLEQLLISTGLSIGDMMVALPFGASAGAAILGSNAASHTAYDVMERGGSTAQALGLGIAAGVTEYITEKIPLENIFKLAKGPKLTFTKKVINVLKQSGMEGTEEFISEIANNVYDDLIMGEKSNFNVTKNKYIEMGYSEVEASLKAFTDCYVVNPLMAFAGGAISGGVMGTGGVTVSDFKQNMMTKTEKDVSKIVRNAVVPSTEPSSKQVTPAQTDNKVISTEMSDVGKAAEMKQNNENVASDNGNVEKSTKPLTIEQKIRAFLKSENKRVSTATGKTLTEDAFSIVEPTTRKQKNLVKDCASLGIEVRYIKTQNNDIIGTSHNINGAYRDGVIYINEDAQNPYRVVLGHEVTHQIKVTDVKAYNALEDIARKHIGESFDNLTLDKQEEAVADFVGAVMDNPRAYKSVFQQNRNLLQRFIEAVDSIIGKFRGTETYNDDLGKMLDDTKAELTGEDVGETKYNYSLDFGQQLQDWFDGQGKKYGTYNGEYFDFGTTPDKLIKHGASKNKTIITENCIIKVTGGKHSISIDELKKLPFELNDPVLLFKSTYKDKFGNSKKAFVALTELKDKSGNDVIAAIHINVSHGHNIVDRISSIYSKSDEFGNNKILEYVNTQIGLGNLCDGNIKKASNWFTTKGLQLPNVVQTIIDANNMVSQDEPIVNNNYMQDGENDTQGTTKHSRMTEKANKLQRKDPTKLTENDFRELLDSSKRKVFSDNTYIPARTNTPQILIDFAKELGYILENHPLAMSVYKTRQALSNEQEWDGYFHDKPHNLTSDEIIDIIKGMDNPSYLVFQTQNERFAEIVKFTKDGGNAKAYAIIDFFDIDKNPEYMNGYNGGKYNILVTIYPSDDSLELKQYLNNKNNIVLTGDEIKKKTSSQRGSGSFVPSHLNDLAFYNDSITNPEEKVKDEISDTTKHSRMTENADTSAASEQQSNVIDSNSKVNNYLRRARTMFVNDVEELMNIPKVLKNNDLKQVFNQLWNEYKESGKIAPDSFNKVFDMLYENGKAISTEFYEQYKDLKADIRNTHFRITDDIKSSIPDFEQFRRRNISTFKTAADGVSVDSYYEELSASYPDLFPEDIIAPADRLLRIAEVAKSIKPQEDGFDTFSPEYKDHIRQQFENSFSKVTDQFHWAKRYLDDKVSVDSEEDVVYTAEQVEQLYKQKTLQELVVEKLKDNELLTEKDETTAERLAKGEITVDEIPKDCWREGVIELGNAQKELFDTERSISKHNDGIKAMYRAEAEALIESSDDWKDSKAMFKFTLLTPERIIRSIVKNEDVANRIINKFFVPIGKANAKTVKFINGYAKRVDALKLTKEESEAVQFIGEKQASITNENDAAKKEELTKELEDFFLEHKNLDMKKINFAIKEFRAIYNDIFKQINDVLIANGYGPIEYRKDYFPHFTEDDSNLLNKIAKVIGVDTSVTELPADLTGKTAAFRPGKTFFQNALQRKGNTTTFDAVEGFNRYIKGAADVIFQTENIQRLRALDNAIRYKYSKKGVQEAIKKIEEDPFIAFEDKKSRIDDLTTKNLSKHNGLVNWLTEYTNVLANKKSYADRPDEKNFGRTLTYRLSLWWQKNYAVNMVLHNVSSALSNTVPLQQAYSVINSRDFACGMYDTIKNIKESDGFADKSDFLTIRKGAFAAGETKLQKFGEAANLMEHTDLFVCQAIVRARYYENMRVRKMSEAEALAEADDFAKSLIAGRGKGDLPLIFTETTFKKRLFTSFQLEVNNQLQFLFKDAPKRILDEKGIKGLANYIIKYLISAYIYNEFFEKITGRKIAIDPLGFVESCIESYTGIRIPNKLDMLMGEKIKYEKNNDGFDRVGAVFKTAKEEITDQIPFVGSLLGGGRIPAAMAIPDMVSIGSSIKNLVSGEGDVGKNVENLITDGILPLAYGFNKFGGLNQAKKTVQGISTVMKGEVLDNKGKLKYGVEQTLGNYIKGAILGPSSLKDTRDFYDAGGKGLTDTEQKYYDKVTESGVSKYEAYQNVIGVRNAKNEISRKNTFYRIMSNDKFVGNVKLGADNAAYQEIMRLKKADTGISLDYTVPDNSFKVNGEDVFLTNAKYRKYASECSKSALDGIKTLIATDYYKKASDVEKAELIEEIYSYSKGISKTKVSKYEPESDVLKATLAKKSKVSVGDYFTFKKQLPEKYNEADAYSLTQELKMSEEQATMLTNLSKYSYDQCKRLQDAGGFKYSQQVRRLYTSMRQRGYDCDTIYAPMVSKTFKYTNKKQGISYETQLSDDDMLKLQKVYLHLYEKKLGEAFQHNYRSIESLYDTVESARYSTMTEAKKIFYQYLQQKK